MKALITGASSGIGRDMARVLAAKGWDLILCARRLDRLEALKKELPQVEIQCIEADLSIEAVCYSVYEQVRTEHIDLLINNAGFGLCGSFEKLNLEQELSMIDTNIKAVHILTKLFLQDFIKEEKGRILNTASSAGFMPGPMMATYYATKSYIVRLSEAIYEELRRQNSPVKISVLCPGPVDTEFDQVADVNFSLKGLNSYEVAKYGIEKALKGKLIIIPGFSLKLGKFAQRLVSEKLLLKISYRIQKRKK